MKVAYILSMKKGLLRFHYREIEELTKLKAKVHLFPTKFSTGQYMPQDDWPVYRYSWASVLASNFMLFLKSPAKYFVLVVESVKYSSVIDFVIAADMSWQIFKNQITNIHCHFGDHKLFIGYFCKQITGLPLTVTIHAHELYRNPNWKMFVHSLKACDRIISISDYNKKYLVEKFKVKPEKIEVVRLFVDKRKHLPEYKKILIVGSFEERKGYDVLFKALAKMRRKDYRLWVVGEGHDKGSFSFGLEGKKDMREWVKKLGLSEQVVFFGQLPSHILDILYDSCDFFVLPSKSANVAGGSDSEGIPVVLMEAMEAGKAVITTRHAGIPELVSKCLVKENSVDELASAIKNLLDNKEEDVTENTKIIEKKYSSENVKKLKAVFLEVQSGDQEI